MKKPIVISVCNLKGGVGKSTTTQNLAFGLAAKGKKVLLIDTDGQANLTQAIGFNENLEPNVFHLLKGEAEMKDIRLRISGNISLLPGGIELAKADLELSGRAGRERLLSRAISTALTSLGEFDFILNDCPPSLGLSTQNALLISDYVIIPTLTEYLPVKGIEMFISSVKGICEDLEKKNLGVLGILAVQHKQNRTLSQVTLEGLEEDFPGLVFDTKIRVNVAISEAQLSGKSVFDYAPDSNGAADYLAFTEEVLQRLIAAQ